MYMHYFVTRPCLGVLELCPFAENCYSTYKGSLCLILFPEISVTKYGFKSFTQPQNKGVILELLTSSILMPNQLVPFDDSLHGNQCVFLVLTSGSQIAL